MVQRVYLRADHHEDCDGSPEMRQVVTNALARLNWSEEQTVSCLDRMAFVKRTLEGQKADDMRKMSHAKEAPLIKAKYEQMLSDEVEEIWRDYESQAYLVHELVQHAHPSKARKLAFD